MAVQLCTPDNRKFLNPYPDPDFKNLDTDLDHCQKSKKLVLWSVPTSPEKLIKIRSQTAEKHCKMSVYAQSANGKESRKTIRAGSTKEFGLLPKSNRFLPHLSKKLHQNKFITFGDILFTRNDYMHTNRHIQ